MNFLFFLFSFECLILSSRMILLFLLPFRSRDYSPHVPKDSVKEIDISNFGKVSLSQLVRKEVLSSASAL